MEAEMIIKALGEERFGRFEQGWYETPIQGEYLDAIRAASEMFNFRWVRAVRPGESVSTNEIIRRLKEAGFEEEFCEIPQTAMIGSYPSAYTKRHDGVGIWLRQNGGLRVDIHLYLSTQNIGRVVPEGEDFRSYPPDKLYRNYSVGPTRYMSLAQIKKRTRPRD